MGDLPDLNRERLTIREAVQLTGFTRSYFARLLKAGHLEGFRLDREWFLYADSLVAFLAKERKRGPKAGKRGASDANLSVS
jgi:hypothetical protein